MKAALKEYNRFPIPVREHILTALRLAVRGEKATTAKPMKGFGAGVFEISVSYRTDAYRVVYAVRIGEDIWVAHAFQKKSTQGIKTPKKEIDLVRDRIKQLKGLER